ncbi:MAG: hypothetical protein GT600_01900 [Bacteroidales bacterium]|nr:hypothetical protein [Bacteroidales bacterium]
MKKLVLTLSAFLIIISLNAQSLEDIIGKYTVANKLDKITSFKSLKITGKVSVMGMDMPVEVWMKSPNKIKTVTTMNGQATVQAFDGEKGYIINAMMGSTEPVEMTPDQVSQIQNNNVFRNALAEYLKKGQLTLNGEEDVNGKPAYKIKAALEGGLNATLFIDKNSFLVVKQIADVNQGGMKISVETYPSDYKDNNGIILPMKNTVSMSGMEMVTSYSKVEVDILIDDSVFKLK